VNNEPVADEILREEYRSLRLRMIDAMPHEDPALLEKRAREWARDNVIERVLLKQAALADEEPIPAEVIEKAHEKAGDRAEDVLLQFRIERLAVRHAGRISSPRHKDVVEYYRQHRDQMTIPEALRASHILKQVDETHPEADALAAIRAAEERLKAGEPFETLADEASDCPGNGGDLGWFPRGEMVPEFETVVFAMQPSQVSPIFRSPFGFHIAKVLARSEERTASFEEAQPQIETHLLREKHQKALERFCDYLRARAVIQDS
jgi:parvulin-like peptidyl-prolyl isomerase